MHAHESVRWLISASILLALLLGGSTNTIAPVVLFASGAGCLVTLWWILGQQKRSLRFSLSSVCLLVMAVLTLVQAVPLPSFLVSTLSSHRTSVHGNNLPTWMALSYEPQETIRIASRLLGLSMLDLSLFNLFQLEKTKEKIRDCLFFFVPLMLIVAALHQVFGLRSLFGLEPLPFSGVFPATIFVNDNHAAASLSVISVVALGQFLCPRPRVFRAWCS